MAWMGWVLSFFRAPRSLAPLRDVVEAVLFGDNVTHDQATALRSFPNLQRQRFSLRAAPDELQTSAPRNHQAVTPSQPALVPLRLSLVYKGLSELSVDVDGVPMGLRNAWLRLQPF